SMVRQLRTWRPSVLVIQQPETGAAPMRLAGQAALKAGDQAADSTRFLEQQELGGLAPRPVIRVFWRLAHSRWVHASARAFRDIPHWRSTTGRVATTAEGLFRADDALAAGREAYRLLRSQWDDGRGATIPGGLFAGLSIPAGSAARRNLAVVDDADLEARQKI